jgi:hypothetical protein
MRLRARKTFHSVYARVVGLTLLPGYNRYTRFAYELLAPIYSWFTGRVI